MSITKNRNGSQAGDWLIFPANLREVHRPVRRLSNVVPGKMCPSPLALPVNGYLLAIRQSVLRGQPYGSEAWQRNAATRMGLESTFRPPRPTEEARCLGRTDTPCVIATIPGLFNSALTPARWLPQVLSAARFTGLLRRGRS